MVHFWRSPGGNEWEQTARYRFVICLLWQARIAAAGWREMLLRTPQALLFIRSNSTPPLWGLHKYTRHYAYVNVLKFIRKFEHCVALFKKKSTLKYRRKIRSYYWMTQICFWWPFCEVSHQKHWQTTQSTFITFHQYFSQRRNNARTGRHTKWEIGQLHHYFHPGIWNKRPPLLSYLWETLDLTMRHMPPFCRTRGKQRTLWGKNWPDLTPVYLDRRADLDTGGLTLEERRKVRYIARFSVFLDSAGK